MDLEGWKPRTGDEVVIKPTARARNYQGVILMGKHKFAGQRVKVANTKLSTKGLFGVIAKNGQSSFASKEEVDKVFVGPEPS